MSEEHDTDKNDPLDVSAYKKKLNERLPSGGGCAEAWEATQEQRQTGRRRFLGVLGGLLLGTSAAGTVSAEDINLPESPNTTVEELDGQETKDVLKAAKRDEQFTQLLHELTSRGLTPNVQTSVAYRSQYKDREWRFVRVPFEGHVTETSYRSGGLIWTEFDGEDPHAYISHMEIKENGSLSNDVVKALDRSGSDYQSKDTVPIEITHTSLRSDGKTISEERNSRTAPMEQNPSGNSSIGTQSLGDCACTSIFGGGLCFPCGTPKLDCIYDLANAYAAEIVACGVCLAPTGGELAECAVCIAAIIDNDEWIFCCYCDLGGPWI